MKLIDKQHVTIIQSTPSDLQSFYENQYLDMTLNLLEILMFGGEALDLIAFKIMFAKSFKIIDYN